MARMSLEEIRARVQHEVGESFLAPFVRKVEVESSDFDDDDTFRVLVTVRNPRRIDIPATNDLVDRLRTDLMADDDRFPVFYFPEAA